MSGILGSLYTDYMIEGLGNLYDYFGRPPLRSKTPPGTFINDKQKCKPKQEHEFIIKGKKIMATSRKDAIKKYNHLKKK